jgi:hypothetical protein
MTNFFGWPLEILHFVMGYLENELGSMLSLALACRYMKVRPLGYFIADSIAIEYPAVKSFFVTKVISLLGQRRFNNVCRAYLNKRGELKLNDSLCLVYLLISKA